MLHQTPVVTCVEELTLVVVSREETCRDEPYRGHPPENDACHVFAQDPSESAFLFDLRLRECLDNPTLLRTLARAVLVCTSDLGDREILRRVRLVAARVRPGGSVTLSYNTTYKHSPDFAGRLTRLAEFASAALAAHGVKITALPVSKLAEESAPLSAAWQRLQRHRSGTRDTHPNSTRQPSDTSSTVRNVFTKTVVHQRRTQSTHVDWSPTPMPMPALILPR